MEQSLRTCPKTYTVPEEWPMDVPFRIARDTALIDANDITQMEGRKEGNVLRARDGPISTSIRGRISTKYNYRERPVRRRGRKKEMWPRKQLGRWTDPVPVIADCRRRMARRTKILVLLSDPF